MSNFCVFPLKNTFFGSWGLYIFFLLEKAEWYVIVLVSVGLVAALAAATVAVVVAAATEAVVVAAAVAVLSLLQYYCCLITFIFWSFCI